MADNHTHDIAFDSETDDQVVFCCTKCKRTIGFFKPETGRLPVAKGSKGKWEIPKEHITSTLGQICDK